MKLDDRQPLDAKGAVTEELNALRIVASTERNKRSLLLHALRRINQLPAGDARIAEIVDSCLDGTYQAQTAGVWVTPE